MAWDGLTSDVALLRSVERSVQRDLYDDVVNLGKRYSTPQALDEAMQGLTTMRAPGIAEYFIVKLTRKGSLLGWSSNQYVPGPQAIEQQLITQDNEILVEKNLVFYNIKQYADSVVYFKLIPLKVTFPIKNENLADYVYLGAYNTEQKLERELTGKRFSLLPVSEGINLRDEDGNHLFSVKIPDPTPFRRDMRLWAIGCLLAGLAVAVYGFVRYVTERLPRSWANLGILIGGLLAMRLLLLISNLPGAYVNVELFSPSLLAINALNPSLGDVTLNCVLVLFVAYRCLVFTLPDGVACWWAQYGGNGWLVFHVLFTAATVILFFAFFALFDFVTLNTKIHYDFSDLFRLNFYSLLFFFNMALVLVSIFVLLYLMACISVMLTRHTGTPSARAWWLLAAGLPVVLLLRDENAELPAYLAFAAMPLGLRQFAGKDTSLRFALIPSLLLIAVLAALTNLGISKSLRRNIRQSLDNYAVRFANPQDFIAEYVFDEVAENIANDRTLWSADSNTTEALNNDIINRIVSNHLIANFRGYDFQVFAFDDRGDRIDAQFDLRHYNRLTYQRRRDGRTLSEKLFLVPYDKQDSKLIYVGYFPVYTPTFGKIFLQIEFHPKVSAGTKLYPTLLVDQSVRQKLTLPVGFQVAVYQNGILQRHEGDFSFPVKLKQAAGNQGKLSETNTHFDYIRQVGADRTVRVLADKRRLFDQITAFSFLYYFYMLFLGLYLLPAFVKRLRDGRLQMVKNNFVFRIQFFMGLVGFLPLLVLWLLSSPLFARLYQQDAIAGLKQNLQQVSDFLENDPDFILDVNSGKYPLAQSIATTNRVSNLLGTDVNVYNLQGMLFTTTRPKIYQTALTSVYINPVALSKLSKGLESELIENEQIGKLSYFSGYIPLYDYRGNLRGYLNLPYLSQQGLLETQVKRFAGYLVNLYVVLLLGIIVGGIFITRSLTQPLTMLRQKIEAIKLGRSNERLQWRSNDEIGSIISSYNKMLETLEESELKLAKNERELAWRQMAQQIAHEIKNPLTPMKLSIQHLLSTLQRNGGDPQSNKTVEKISKTLLSEIDTLSSIASSFSQFATMPSSKQVPVSLNEVLQQVTLLYGESREGKVVLHLPEQDVRILGDTDQLNRVFGNLIKNALQAMPPDRPALQSIVTVTLSAPMPGDEEPADYVYVSVADNGTGIADDVKGRIFEPSFSTKTSGMGLGLAITQRLVESMEGRISFTSQVNVGTVFTLTFPLLHTTAPLPANGS